MSLTPVFSPAKSAFRFDEIAFEKFEDVDVKPTAGSAIPSVDVDPAGTFACIASSYNSRIEKWSMSDDDIGGTSLSDTISISAVDGTVGFAGVQFSGDGQTVFIGTGSHIEEHSLSTAYGGTATYQARIAGPDGVDGFHVVDGGTKIIAIADKVFYEVNLSAAWDLSSAGAWSLPKLDLSSVYDFLDQFTLGRSERQMIVIETQLSGSGERKMHEYTLSAAGDISSALFVRSFDYSDVAVTGGANLKDIVYGDGGRKLYAVTGDRLIQYSTVS